MKTWKAKYNDLVKQRDYKSLGLQEQLKIANKRIAELKGSKENGAVTITELESFIAFKLLEAMADLEVSGE